MRAPSELAKAIVAGMETSEGRSEARDGVRAQLTGKTPQEMKQQVLEMLARVGADRRRQGTERGTLLLSSGSS